MKVPVRESARWATPAALAIGLLGSPIAATTAMAQAPPGPEGEVDKSGRPLDG